MSRFTYKIILLIFGCFSSYIYSQDSLIKKPYKELLRLMQNSKNKDTRSSVLYANTYLLKAKSEKNIKKVSEGYEYLGSFKKYELNLKYLDSSIQALEGHLIYKMLSSTTYYKKGLIEYHQGQYKKALNNFLTSNSLARKYNYSDVIFKTNYMIGRLANRVGLHKESITIHREYLKYIKIFNKVKVDSIQYYRIINDLTLSYNRLKNTDSASYFCDIGLKSTLNKKSELYSSFIMSSATIIANKGNLESALNILPKKLNHNNVYSSLNTFYKGEILYKLGKKEKGIKLIKQLDSIFINKKIIFPEIKNAYEILIDYNKKNKSIENELKYNQRLIKFDSILDFNYKSIQNTILKKHYTPKVLSKKLKKESNSFWSLAITSFSFLIIFLVFFMYYFKKQKYYKKQFNKLIASSYENPQNSKKYKNIKRNITSLNISESVKDQILDGLDKFESNKRYLNSKYTLASLAKELKTNSSYLSKVINVSKDKNFSNYINELRIDYVYKELIDNSQFRLYSIKGISEEVGFKNSESFSKAFYKKTGIYPSYYIKELNKL